MGKLPADDQAGVLALALQAAQAVPEAWRRVDLLTALVDKLPVDDQAGVLALALQAAQAVPEAWLRAAWLTALVGRQQQDAYDRAAQDDHAILVHVTDPSRVREQGSVASALSCAPVRFRAG